MRKILVLMFSLCIGCVVAPAQKQPGVHMEVRSNILLVRTFQSTGLINEMLWTKCAEQTCSYMAHGILQIQKQPPVLVKKILAIRGVESLLVLEDGTLSIKKLPAFRWAKISRSVLDVVLSVLPHNQNLTASLAVF